MRLRERLPAITLVGIVVVMLALLAAMGRVVWCKCGTFAIANWDPWSMHNSQHLVDPYSFTHVLHGFVFFALLRVVLADRFMAWWTTLALGVEAAWEVVENTPWVINRYRETTVSLDYTGDTLANSAADLACCALGLWLARRLPAWASVTAFFGTELALALWIRDSLLLNVLMLVWPIEAVRTWQSGG